MWCKIQEIRRQSKSGWFDGWISRGTGNDGSVRGRVMRGWIGVARLEERRKSFLDRVGGGGSP